LHVGLACRVRAYNEGLGEKPRLESKVLRGQEHHMKLNALSLETLTEEEKFAILSVFSTVLHAAYSVRSTNLVNMEKSRAIWCMFIYKMLTFTLNVFTSC